MYFDEAKPGPTRKQNDFEGLRSSNRPHKFGVLFIYLFFGGDFSDIKIKLRHNL